MKKSMPGIDRIPMEVFKEMNESALAKLSDVFNEIIINGKPIPVLSIEENTVLNKTIQLILQPLP